jgi:hypothetical protein
VVAASGGCPCPPVVAVRHRCGWSRSSPRPWGWVALVVRVRVCPVRGAGVTVSGGCLFPRWSPSGALWLVAQFLAPLGVGCARCSGAGGPRQGRGELRGRGPPGCGWETASGGAVTCLSGERGRLAEEHLAFARVRAEAGGAVEFGAGLRDAAEAGEEYPAPARGRTPGRAPPARGGSPSGPSAAGPGPPGGSPRRPARCARLRAGTGPPYPGAAYAARQAGAGAGTVYGGRPRPVGQRAR